MRKGGDLGQGGREGSQKWLDIAYIPSVDPARFVLVLMCCVKKRERNQE